jgi:hypothetical protein
MKYWTSAGRRLLLAPRPQLCEEPLQQRDRLDRKNAGRDLETVIHSNVAPDLEEGHDSARFRIGRAEDEAPNARIHERSRAHGAGLERDEERAIVEPPMPAHPGSRPDGNDFRVRRRVFVELAPVLSTGKFDPVRPDDDGTDGNVSVGRRATRLIDGNLHPARVFVVILLVHGAEPTGGVTGAHTVTRRPDTLTADLSARRAPDRLDGGWTTGGRRRAFHGRFALISRVQSVHEDVDSLSRRDVKVSKA